mmetsp:Transcript_177920/g.564620  ORF Transcript_177920/g.564620 Transcript_177920/m.564620 type:complete len:298 (-) Transcript_177920:1526-2419(-)
MQAARGPPTGRGMAAAHACARPSSGSPPPPDGPAARRRSKASRRCARACPDLHHACRAPTVAPATAQAAAGHGTEWRLALRQRPGSRGRRRRAGRRPGSCSACPRPRASRTSSGPPPGDRTRRPHAEGRSRATACEANRHLARATLGPRPHAHAAPPGTVASHPHLAPLKGPTDPQPPPPRQPRHAPGGKLRSKGRCPPAAARRRAASAPHPAAGPPATAAVAAAAAAPAAGPGRTRRRHRPRGPRRGGRASACPCPPSPRRGIPRRPRGPARQRPTWASSRASSRNLSPPLPRTEP